MKALYDTSVLVASDYEEHEFHAVAVPWLDAAAAGHVEMVVSAHSLAEFYSGVTRLPRGWAVTSSADRAQLRSLPANRYVRLIARLASLGLEGGVVYDGVVAEVARLARADALVTLNPSDFTRLGHDDLRIVDPRDEGPPKTDARS